VSNVINERGGFSALTRERVESAVQELGFQPNRSAQSLRSRRTMLFGFDMSGKQLEASNPFTISFLRALVSAAHSRQYRVVAFTHEESGIDGLRSTVASGLVDGFVLSDASTDDGRFAVLTSLGVPFVVFGRTPPDLPQCWVDIDNHAAMAAPVDHLIAAGYVDFAFVGHMTDIYWNHDRYHGALDRLREKGFDLPASRTVLCPPEDQRDLVARLLADAPRPTAVIASSDSSAILVANAATATGLRVGKDLAITGFDAGPLCTMVEPSLTSVRIPVDRVADALIDRLVNELGGGGPAEGELVPTDLVLGGST
jgi:DNA-binding LacI/PurR family transcriptional regulator